MSRLRDYRVSLLGLCGYGALFVGASVYLQIFDPFGWRQLLAERAKQPVPPLRLEQTELHAGESELKLDGIVSLAIRYELSNEEEELFEREVDIGLGGTKNGVWSYGVIDEDSKSPYRIKVSTPSKADIRASKEGQGVVVKLVFEDRAAGSSTPVFEVPVEYVGPAKSASNATEQSSQAPIWLVLPPIKLPPQFTAGANAVIKLSFEASIVQEEEGSRLKTNEHTQLTGA